ncbi:MAG: DUF4430 domain-containing protein [bacterium]
MRHLLLILGLLICCLAADGCEPQTETLASFTVVASDSGNVFAQTRSAHQIEYDSVEAGVFIKSIEGVSQSNRAYWLYQVNGQPGNVACEQFLVAPGDTIIWKLTSLY